MQLTIDVSARQALYDAASMDITAISDLYIDKDGYPRGREVVRDLWDRLRLYGPLLDQIGWQPEPDREFFDLRVSVRAMRRILRRHVSMMERYLGESVTTETQLRQSTATRDGHAGTTTTEDEFADELAEMRANVDRALELLAAYRRLLDVVNGAANSDLDRALAEIEAAS